MKRILYVIIIAILAVSCERRSENWATIADVESYIEEHPDSALAVLRSIDSSELSGGEESARYALLMSIALDKNLVDTTSFAVLQPAIDYYLENGTPDEKLRTLYYQACIYRNRGDESNSMTSCIKALNVEGITDSLTLARVLVGQSVLFDQQYKINEFAENNIRAAKLFHSAKKYNSEIRCYAKALDVAVINDDKSRADSLVGICITRLKECPEVADFFNYRYLSYLTKYGTDDDLRTLLSKLDEKNTSVGTRLNMARAYTKLGGIAMAQSLLDGINPGNEMDIQLKYYAVLSEILEKANDSVGALDAYKNYMSIAECFHIRMLSNDLLFAERRHDLEISNLIEIQHRNKIILYGLFAIIILLIFTVIILHRYFKVKSKRALAEHEKQKAMLEKENLRYELKEMDSEKAKLEKLLKNKAENAEPIQQVISERLNLINSLLAKEITNDETYAVPYRKWIERIRLNKEEFMASTLLALKATHPAFIDFLENHNLSNDEIKYICLYAIGLKGKEIGVYLQSKSHYNISSTIRRKLGIDEHETNLSIYVRRKLKEYE